MPSRSTADDTMRLAALAHVGILDTPPEPRFDDLVHLAKEICDVPIALVSLIDAERQWFKAKIGVEVDETPLETSVCALVIRQDRLFVIPDLSLDPRTAHFSLVAQPPHLRFYAGFPIVTAAGIPVGSLCAIDVVPRPAGLSPRQAAALEALARQVSIEIEGTISARSRRIGNAAARSIGIWDWDIPSGRMTADAGFARLYGVDPEIAARGAPGEAFLANVHPDDVERLRREMDHAIATGEAFDCEHRLIQPDGRSHWAVAQGRRMLGPDGTPARFPGVSFDIDSRKRAELRLAAIVELSDRLRGPGSPAELGFAAAEILGHVAEVSRVGYGTIDRTAETIRIERDWNAPGIASLAGTLRFRDYGSYIDELKRGETVAIADAYADPRTRGSADALKAISAQSLINIPLTEQGGFVALLYLNHATAREWSQEEIAFVREVAERTRDAVERRRAELELAALTASLEAEVEARTGELMIAEESLRQAHKMEAVGQLTGGLAHDFNNLLTGIAGAIEMMQVRIAQGRIAELERYASAAQGAVKRAAALTHRLLAFSRRQTLDPRPTDVNRLVAGMQELIQRTAGPAVAVEVVGAVGLWPAIVDPNQLENALLNLCINARDAMPEGGRITIETANRWLDERAARERELRPGQFISLCVTDTGVGMTPAIQARAFDPFYTTKPLGQGTGLGLSMIYGFARQSGGQVRIYTEVGIGTTMCIYLPRHYGTADEDRAQPAAGLAATAAAADGRQTVLVVDDEPTIRMLVLEVLEELGYVAVEAGDGAEAMRVLQSSARIDLVITDVGLPGAMNGRQVADAALALRPELKILFITGYAENAVIGNGQLGPAMALITKPFAMDALAAKVRSLID